MGDRVRRAYELGRRCLFSESGGASPDNYQGEENERDVVCDSLAFLSMILKINAKRHAAVLLLNGISHDRDEERDTDSIEERIVKDEVDSQADAGEVRLAKLEKKDSTQNGASTSEPSRCSQAASVWREEVENGSANFDRCMCFGIN